MVVGLTNDASFFNMSLPESFSVAVSTKFVHTSLFPDSEHVGMDRVSSSNEDGERTTWTTSNRSSKFFLLKFSFIQLSMNIFQTYLDFEITRNPTTYQYGLITLGMLFYKKIILEFVHECSISFVFSNANFEPDDRRRDVPWRPCEFLSKSSPQISHWLSVRWPFRKAHAVLSTLIPMCYPTMIFKFSVGCPLGYALRDRFHYGHSLVVDIAPRQTERHV